MKFETPIAEIELFELKDIISTSGASEPTETEDDTSDVGQMFEGNCIYHDARDSDNWNNCL